MRDYKLRFEDIRDACRKVIRYSAGLSIDEFLADDKTFDAVLRNLEIIGEAANHVPDKIQEQHPEIDWYSIVGLRNIVAHKYFGIDVDIIWDLLKNHVPNLMRNIEAILEDI